MNEIVSNPGTKEIVVRRHTINEIIRGNSERLWDRIGPLLAKAPAIVEVLKSLSGEKNILVAEIPSMLKSKFESGELVLCRDKNGDLLAQLRGNKGFSKHLRIKEAEASSDLARSLNDFMVQQQLAQIVNMIEHVQHSIDRVLDGQYDDRFALCQSAEQQVLNARLVADEQVRRQMFLNSIQTAEDARNTVMLVLKRDIDYICGLKYGGLIEDVNTNPKEVEVEKRMRAIVAATQALHKASITEAVAFHELGEPAAMTNSIDFYLRFVSKNFSQDRCLLLSSNQGNKKIIDWVQEMPRLEREIPPLLKMLEMESEAIPAIVSRGNNG